jgi:acyl dehydratase
MMMKLDRKFAGLGLKQFSTEVTWRRTMNYAAAVHDNNPVYLDDERGEGIVAPPMFAVAATWPISERIWEYIPAVDFPREILLTQVHYTEHLIFHRPVRPGDNLTIKGSIASISPHKSGTLVVLQYQAVDEKGESVFTEYMGGLMRGVECFGEGGPTAPLPVPPSFAGAGEALREIPIFIDPLAPFVYDGCTNIFFPIHTSAGFAHRVGLPGIILQGTATLAYAVREITNLEAGGDPGALKAVACRFTGMVRPGSEIRVILMGRQVDDRGTDLFFKVLNSEGSAALSNGYARVE